MRLWLLLTAVALLSAVVSATHLQADFAAWGELGTEQQNNGYPDAGQQQDDGYPDAGQQQDDGYPDAGQQQDDGYPDAGQQQDDGYPDAGQQQDDGFLADFAAWGELGTEQQDDGYPDAGQQQDDGYPDAGQQQDDGYPDAGQQQDDGFSDAGQRQDYPDADVEQDQTYPEGGAEQGYFDAEKEDAFEREMQALTEQIEGEDKVLAAEDKSLAGLQEDDFTNLQEYNLADVEQDKEGEEPSEEELEALLQQVKDDDDSLADLEEEMALAEQDGDEGEGGEGGTAVAQWNNKFDGPLHVFCPPGQGLYGVKSVHSNKKEDRLYSWYCKKVYSGKQSAMQILRVRLHKGSIRKIRRHFRNVRKKFRRHNHKLKRRLQKARYRHLSRLYRLTKNKLRRYRQRYFRLRKKYKRLLLRYRSLLRRYKSMKKKPQKKPQKKVQKKPQKKRNPYLTQKGCFWKKVNSYDQKVNYRCPKNMYLAGLFSQHDNHKEDREWHMYCCRTPGICTKSCKQTGYINKFDGPMNYKAKGILTGLFSVHDNKKEDRRWKVTYCTMAKC